MEQRQSGRDALEMDFIKSGFQNTDLLPGHELVAQAFEFKPHDIGARKKAFVRLCLTDIVMGGVQIIKPGGGENAMHSHNGQDGIYFVLKGRVQFYGAGDKLIADLAQHQGVAIPRGYKYWMAAAGDEEAHMLQISAFDRSRDNKHTTYGPPAKQDNTFGMLVLDGKSAAAPTS